MSDNYSAKTAAEKAQEAADKAKAAVAAVARDAGHALHEGVENAKDFINEKIHRGNAEAERTRRDVAGDALTPGEKIGSVVNEAKNDAQADVDELKQRARKL